MINDLSNSSGDFDGDMLKNAHHTNVSEYISNEEFLQDIANSIVNWSAYNKFQFNPIKYNKQINRSNI
jgi:hypothetical protein